MYANSETRSNVFEKWLVLAEFSGLEDHISFYLDNGIISRPSDLYKLNLRHLYQNRDIPEESVHRALESIENTKELSMARVLLCLLPDIVPNKIKKITSVPGSIEDIADRCSESEYSADLLEELYRLSQLGIDLVIFDDPIFDIFDAPKQENSVENVDTQVKS